MAPFRFMHGAVARFAQRMKDVGGLLGHDALIGEPAKRFFKIFAFAHIERMVGGNDLGQKLGKLAQLDDRCAGVIAKIPLCQQTKL